MGILLALIAACSFGVTRVFAALALHQIKPLSGTAISLVGSLVFALAASLLFQFKALTSISMATVGWFALIGIISYPLARTLTFTGVKYIGASRSTPIYCTYPLFTMIFSTIFLREKVSLVLLIGALLIVGAMALLVSEQESETTLARGSRPVAGFLFSLASAVLYGASMTIARWGVSHLAPPIVGATVSIFFGTLVLWLITGKSATVSAKSYPRASAIWLLVGAGSAIGTMSMYAALSRAPAVLVTPLGGTSPLFTVLFSYIFLRKFEKITPRVVISCIIVVAGGILVSRG